MGEILQTLRKDKKKTQLEIAEYLGMTQGGYRKYEADLIEPNIETLKKLADYYHVTIDYLVGRHFANDIGYLNDQDRAFLKLYNKLDEKGKNKVSGYISAILTLEY